jgi:hypothetical protein
MQFSSGPSGQRRSRAEIEPGRSPIQEPLDGRDSPRLRSAPGGVWFHLMVD